MRALQSSLVDDGLRLTIGLRETPTDIRAFERFNRIGSSDQGGEGDRDGDRGDHECRGCAGPDAAVRVATGGWRRCEKATCCRRRGVSGTLRHKSGF